MATIYGQKLKAEVAKVRSGDNQALFDLIRDHVREALLEAWFTPVPGTGPGLAGRGMEDGRGKEPEPPRTG